MTQNKKKEIIFFDKLAEEKHEFSSLSEKCFERLFSELSKSLIKKPKNIRCAQKLFFFVTSKAHLKRA